MRLRDLARNTALVVAGSLVTAGAGLLLRVALAWRFGPSGETDALVIAIQAVDGFAVPVAGIVAAVAIPELARLADQAEADAVTRRLLWGMAMIFGATAVVLGSLAGPLAQWMVGRPDSEAVALTADMLRWLSVTVVFYGSTGMLVAFAQRQGNYLWPALVLPLRNIGGLVGVALVASGSGIWGAVSGYVAGAVAQMAVLLASVGRRLRPGAPAGWRHPAVTAVQHASVPLLLGAVAVQANLFVTIRYAAMLGEGRATEFNYGSSIAALAAALIGPSLADASFPTLSASSASGDRAAMRRQVTMVVQSALVLSAAMSGLVVALASEVVALLFAGPRFPDDSVARSAEVLRVLGLGLVPLVLQTVFARVLYAERRGGLAQVLVGGALVVNLICQPLLVRYMGLAGVAASLTVSLTASAVALLAALAFWLQTLDLRALGWSAWRSGWAALLVWAAAAGAAHLMPGDQVLLRTAVGAAAGGVALVLALLVGDEMQIRGRLLNLIERRRR